MPYGQSFKKLQAKASVSSASATVWTAVAGEKWLFDGVSSWTKFEDAGGGGGGASRKDGLESLGDVSGAVSVDFTAGSSDNKQFQVIGNVTSWTLTFGPEGVYNMFIKVGTQGFDIPKPTEVKGDWLLVDTTGLTNHVQLMWDGVNARISGVITTDA